MRLRRHLLLMLLLATTGCSKGHEESIPNNASRESPICIAQYVSHPALDQVAVGFKEEISQLGIKSSGTQFFSANGERNTADILADQLCSPKCSVIFALATPMAQSVKSKCSREKPIIFGAITDPISANLVDNLNAPGENITGTSDQWPYDAQMELVSMIWGKGTRVGVPLNPAEANTDYAMRQTRAAAKKHGLSLVEVPVNSMTEATQAVGALAGRVDVIYVPADNTVMAAARGIIAEADRRSIPVVAGDPGTFESGAAVGLGVSYKNLGIINAQQVKKVLDGASPGSLPIAISSNPDLLINEEKARRYKIDVKALQGWYREKD